MNPLLDHYNEELRFLRQEGATFARENPQVAARLGLHSDAITDPFVERLLEGVAFLSARVQSRMDRECAEFAQQALARIAPSFCCVTPSMTTYSFHPDYASPESQRGRSIPRGSVVQSHIPGLARPVQFVTSRTVNLLPLRIAQAECLRAVSGLPNAAAQRLARAPAVLHLKFETEANAVLGDLAKTNSDGEGGLEPLTMSLGGDAPLAFGLQHALLADAEQILLIAHDDRLNHVIELPRSSLRMADMGEQQAMLPVELGGLQGIRLLREYLAQPANFLSFELHGLAQLAKRCPGARSFQVVVGLRKAPQFLLGRVTPALFHLFASPAINLYAKRLDPISYDPKSSTQWLLVDRMKPNAHHLFSLSAVHAVSGQGRLATLAPVVGGVSFDGLIAPGHYGLMRHSIAAQSSHAGDPLASYDRLVVSLQESAELQGRVTSLQLEGLVCDRGWRPESVLSSRLSLREPMGVGRIECLWVPSMPRAMPDLMRCWEAVAFMGESPLVAGRRVHTSALPALIRWLGLAASPEDPIDASRISSLEALGLGTALQPCANAVPVGWVHTLKARLDISSARHADRGAWLFARILAQALSESISLNEGLEVEIRLDGNFASKHSNLVLADGRFL
jgi:type VI secretion system protein ImpG